MKDLLFVYGTLLGSLSNSMTDFLKRESVFIGEAYLKGRLYDLGRYPGIVAQDDSPYEVFGHVYQLSNPEEALKVLDYYEDIPDGKQTTSEYIRALAPVRIENNYQHCWVYMYNKSTANLKEIDSGNYLEYIQNNSDHQGFINSV